ncbi:hypothetical protein THAR02_06227 [Trichoderma harzianum]|uniref:Uncharacterized protein n=1 Tax=Trichoderma harzianum TaxID=5544 RepID=A0A0F9X907_TRIHA|nr:hypothetical protein THAR02_06227 [Trichoderma harzianum]
MLRPLNSETDWDGQNHRSTVQAIENSMWTNGIHRRGNLYLSPPYFLFAETPAICFMTAYLVMNRHFYGASHGIPLQSLQSSASYEEKLALTSLPRFCRHDRQVIKKPVDRRLYITSLTGRWGDVLEDFKSENFNPEKGSCLLCATDYDISLEQDRTEKEWHFALHTYHCLGPCRTPNDQLWAYFTSDFQDAHGFWGSTPERNSESEELQSRHLKLDHGGARRAWYDTI